jgi:thiosulfate dehydrogenase [quinone] large subunit
VYRQTLGTSALRPGTLRNFGWDGSELVAFRLHLPSHIRYHNARDVSTDQPRSVERGNIVTWEQQLADRLDGQPLTIEVRMDSQSILYRTLWLFAGAFHWIAAHPAVLWVVDQLNVWGLLLIGLALVIGVFTRLAAAAGVVLLGLYYMASPPLVGLPTGGAEGSYLIVNKNLVEFCALVVILVTGSGRFAGLDRLLHGLLVRRTRLVTA